MSRVRQSLFGGEAGGRKTHPSSSHPEANADRSSLGAPWLGLLVDHHRLFDALVTGWLPPSDEGGMLVGIGGYATNGQVADTGHRIPVCVRLNRAMLPDVEVPVFERDHWTLRSPERFDSTGGWLFWPGLLPTFAIDGLSVPTEEHRQRLNDLAGQVSDIKLPTEPSVGTNPEPVTPMHNWSGRELDALLDSLAERPPTAVSRNADTAHGAMSMAMWAVPRSEPWIEMLTVSLSRDPSGLGPLAARLDAPWWEFPPWIHITPETAVEPETAWWLAGTEVLRDRIGRGDDPTSAAESIATAATHRGIPTARAAEWLDSTRSILRSESGICLERWREEPVGLAIQLALLRPDPVRFASWTRDLSELPPAVWWSAAALCGLHRGYRRLPAEYRGTAAQQAILSVQALRVSASISERLRWPIVDDGQPGWRRDSGDFALLWGEQEFDRKTESPRGEWLSLDFDDPQTLEQAARAAKTLQWDCVHRRLRLDRGRLSVSGPGTLSLHDRELRVSGGVEIRFPQSARVDEMLDVGEFRKLLATAPGRVPKPPVHRELPGTTVRINEVPGLVYRSEFMSGDEEAAIVREIERSEWIEELRRRVQHYGWRYDYRERTVRDSMRLGSLPGWAKPIAERLVRDGLLPEMPDQLIVNEYLENQGIAAHTDHNRFGEAIAMISLLEDWEMVFRKPEDKTRKHPVLLERRSVAVMAGEARYAWTHEIPKRKSEPAMRGSSRKSRRLRGRRLSLTFRKVLPNRDLRPGDEPPSRRAERAARPASQVSTA